MNGCKPCIGEPARLQRAPTGMCRVCPKERQMQHEPVRALASPNYGLCPKERQMQREPRRRGLQPRLGEALLSITKEIHCEPKTIW